MHLPSANVLVQVIVVGLLTGGVYALMAAGLTLIFGVMKVINIAHGAFLVLSAYIAYWLFTAIGLDPVFSILVSVPVFFVIGIAFQQFVLSRTKNDAGLIVLLTFALALTLEGVMGALWKSTGRSIRTWYTSEVIPVALVEIVHALRDRGTLLQKCYRWARYGRPLSGSTSGLPACCRTGPSRRRYRLRSMRSRYPMSGYWSMWQRRCCSCRSSP